MLINLLENAAKYTPTGTPIEISAARDDSNVIVDVCDHGPGLPPEGEQVFEKFVRGDHLGVSGVGLGLAICKGVVEAHGGTIHASNREGDGAKFRIRLPLVDGPPVIPEPASDVAATSAEVMS